MIRISARHYLLALYLPIILFGFVLFLLNRMALPSPFLINLTFLAMLLLPGFFLKKIISFDFEKDNLGNAVLVISLGFIVNLLLAAGAIFSGLTIDGYLRMYLIVVFGLFISALVIDAQKNHQDLNIDFNKLFKAENLIYVIIFLILILILATVNQLGTNFTGDPLYHLAILRRAVEGQTLSMENLSHLKDQFHLSYVLPVWHIFLALLVKVSGTNIFILFREISTILTLFVFIVWYWLFRKILPTRSVAILALFLFVLFHFEKNGYLFTRLPVPDSLNMLLLMPLCFGLALSYIFQKDSTYKHLIILSVLLPLMGLIHWTQYFYWLGAMGLFAILYAIFKFKDKDFKPIFKKILLATFANLVLVIPVLAFIQLKAQAVSQNMQGFTTVARGSTNDRLYKFDPYFKLSYILLPLIGVFIRKYRRLIFILAVFSAAPIVYNLPWLYGLLRQYLSHVFVNRLYSNLGQWPFLIWAILLGFILVLLDRALSKIKPQQRYWRLIIDGVLGIFLLWMVWGQFQSGMVQNWYNFVFSGSVFDWLNRNYNWLIPVVVIIALAIFILQKYYPKSLDFFQFQEYKNHSTMLILTLVIVFFLGIQSFSHLTFYPKKEIQNWHFFTAATDPTADFINYDKFGGVEAIEFIRTNIPAKSVFDTNTFANYTLPTLVDMHMASYSLDPIAPTKKYKDLYDLTVPIEKKIVMLKEGDIDYLIYQYQTPDKSSPFDTYPQYFIKIYESNSAAIFQINKTAL